MTQSETEGVEDATATALESMYRADSRFRVSILVAKVVWQLILHRHR